MSFKMKDIVPWGRSFDEYVSMFDLSETDLRRTILGCGDGPASFNTTLTRRGGHIVSVDPLYRFNTHEIRYLIDETYPSVMEQTRQNKDNFVWTTIRSVNELGILRMKAMSEFLSDYPSGRKQKRYIDGKLPELPFPDGSFELAICSHLLFLYSGCLSEDFHIESTRELCRVASEVRVFPLVDLDSKPSRHVQPVTARLKKNGYRVTFVDVPYEFQRGGTQMMRICRK